MGGFCRYLSNMFDRDVIDKTGLTGLFDIVVDAGQVRLPDDDASDAPADGMAPRPTRFDKAATARVFQAALPRIGLKLYPARSTGVYLVIDHIERPTGN